MNQKEKNSLLWLGTIVNTHGVKGEVRILADSDNIEKRFSIGEKLFYFDNDNIKKELIIKSSRPHKQFILVIFEGVNNINDIEWIKGTKIYCLREKLDEDEYYISDLLGLEVIDQNNNSIGIVESVVDQGPYDSLNIKLSNGNSTNIPMVDEFKIKYNKEKKKVFVDIPKEFIEK